MKWARIAAGVAAVGLLIVGAGPVYAAGPDLLTWGHNNFGQLSDGTTTNRTTPVFPSLAPGVTVTKIDGGNEDTSFAVTSTGLALAAGNNAVGQLGDGTTTNRTTLVASVFPPGTVITDVAAGRNHTIWLTSTGVLYAAGENAAGQVGDGTTTDRSTPVLVDLPPGTTITKIAAGWDHTIAVDSGGGVLTWGFNSEGQLGDNTTTNRTTPVSPGLPGGTVIVDVAANGNHTLALEDNNTTIWAWGQGNGGQLGQNTVVDHHTPVAVILPGGTSVTAVGAGTNFSLAVTSTGGALAWGLNANGQLGDGTTTQRNLPVTPTLPPGTVVTDASGGQSHTLWLTTAGKILASGRNSEGQLGDGTTTQRLTAVSSLIGAGSTMNVIAAGEFFSMAVGTFSLTGVPLAKFLPAAIALLVALAAGLAWRAMSRRRHPIAA